ncbi:MAG: hypothetical protein AABY15_02200 [Nanoarchaeota archaeon]
MNSDENLQLLVGILVIGFFAIGGFILGIDWILKKINGKKKKGL